MIIRLPATKRTIIKGTIFSATLAILLRPPRVIRATRAMMITPRMRL